MTETPAVEMVPLDAIEFDTMNPQVEDLATFNELVESIRDHGFLEPAWWRGSKRGASSAFRASTGSRRPRWRG